MHVLSVIYLLYCHRNAIDPVYTYSEQMKYFYDVNITIFDFYYIDILCKFRSFRHDCSMEFLSARFISSQAFIM